MSSEDRIVYSIEQGRICPRCASPVNQCTCRKNHHLVMEMCDSHVRRREGKGVTLIKGLDMNYDALILMDKKLRVMCGSGGTVKEGVIETQGDHIVRILDYLKKQGLRAKWSGG